MNHRDVSSHFLFFSFFLFLLSLCLCLSFYTCTDLSILLLDSIALPYNVARCALWLLQLGGFVSYVLVYWINLTTSGHRRYASHGLITNVPLYSLDITANHFKSILDPSMRKRILLLLHFPSRNSSVD